MNIVVLDGHTLNPGDLSWDGIRRLGELTVHDRTAAADVVPRARQADIILTNKTVLNKDQIAALPKLRYIGVLATGYNIVDVAAARQQGIPVSNVPTYGTHSVAQMTFALLLELTHHVGHHSHTVHEGKWAGNTDFCYWDFPLVELSGLTFGIIGYGRIGQSVADVARALGMKVIAFSIPKPDRLPDWVSLRDLDALFKESDVVSLHCPLTPENRGIVNAARLRLMKPSAFLINTSRGPLVDQPALADALNSGRLAGAGVDVLETEPPDPLNPLLKAKNCFITPHISWATGAARRRLMDTTEANIQSFLAGKPQNVVNA